VRAVRVVLGAERDSAVEDVAFDDSGQYAGRPRDVDELQGRAEPAGLGDVMADLPADAPRARRVAGELAAQGVGQGHAIWSTSSRSRS